MKAVSWVGSVVQVFPGAVGEEESLPMQMWKFAILDVQQFV